MGITISYGVNNSVEKPVEDYPNVERILGDERLRQFLGFGDNVEARVNGTSGISSLTDGDEVELITRSNTKG